MKDVALVDEFSEPGGGGSSGQAGGGTTSAGSTNEAGESTVGGDGATAGSAGSGNGGRAGSATAGSGGSGGSGGSAGSNVAPSEIPVLNPCVNTNYLFCDDFEKGVINGWFPGFGPTQDDNAISGTHVMITDYQSSPMLNTAFGQDLVVSFWVKLTGSGDQMLVAFPHDKGGYIGLAREEGRARWAHTADGVPGMLQAGVAPSDDSLAAAFDPDPWFCVEVRVESWSTLHGRIVSPGEAPIDMPTLDTMGTDGIDAEFNLANSDWYLDDTHIRFSDTGSSVLIDDVVIGPPDTASLCDLFLESAAN